MKPIDDLTDLFAEEVLGEMAESFFGSRVEIDHKMELFDQYREELKKKGEMVFSHAGFLNFLLLDKKSAADFYAALNVEPGELAEKERFPDHILPEKMPWALTLTAKGEYVKLVQFAYKALRDMCADYMRGRLLASTAADLEEEVPVTYEMIKCMGEMINEKIKKVNERSTICTLQYTRQFNPENIEKEKFTGGGFAEHGCDNLDKNLKFKPIDFDSLGIPVFPDLPAPDSVKEKVSQFAKKLYSRNSSKAKKAVAEIKSRIQ